MFPRGNIKFNTRMSILIRKQRYFERSSTKLDSDMLYIFGENEKQQWSNSIGGGQAQIRGLNNTFGFPTLKSIGKYWTDEEYSENVVKIEDSIQYIKKAVGLYNGLVFPSNGLGTGRANMQKECPKTFLYLCKRLLEEFNFNNIENLKSDDY